MIKYFRGSIIVTILGFAGAYLWSLHLPDTTVFEALFAVFFLSILEVTLSFDNAIVNAVKLEHMTPVWRKRFLTWGILIAVFGMRLIFPVFFVAVFAGLSIIDVLKLAFCDSLQYAQRLHEVHAPLISFGGTFMMMLFLSYFMNPKKDDFWIAFIEKPLARLGKIKYLDYAVCGALLIVTAVFVKDYERVKVLISGATGIGLFFAINFFMALAEKSFKEEEREKKQLAKLTGKAAKGGLAAFIYLELIDASFSLDGVLSAFAITKDILIMTIGLAIGAMFVRSLTIFMVEKDTLQKFAYLEHGAHWAVGSLAGIMLVSASMEVSEILTGLIGLVIIVAAFTSSLLANRKTAK